MSRRGSPIRQIVLEEHVCCENDPLCRSRRARVALSYQHENDNRFALFPSIKISDGLGFPEVLMAYSRLFAEAAKRVQDSTPVTDYQI